MKSELKTYQLEEIALNICDGVHNTVIDDENGDCLLLSAKNIQNGRIIFDDTDRKINRELCDKLKKRTHLSKNDIAITTVGANVGDLAIIGDGSENYEFQRSVGLIKTNTAIADSIYLFYLLGTKSFNYFFHVIATGSAQPCLFLGTLNKIKVTLPALSKQKRIASILSAYDNLIENNNKRIKILEQMAENLYKEWFVRFRFPGHETTPLENGIPKGWKVKPLNDWLIDNFNGGWGEEDAIGTKYSSPASVIRGTDIEDVKSAIIDDVPLRYHTEKEVSQKSLQVHDIILELSNGNINNIGRTLYIDELLLTHFSSVMCASFCKTLRCKNESDAFYIWLYIQYLQNSGLMNYYKNTGTNGINNFNFKRFLKMKIAMPANCLLKPFVHLYQNIFLLREHNYNLIKQRDLLLPRLMSGKLAV